MSGAVIGTATALAPGTCGELAQGMTGGVDFLITCPVNQFARATATLYAGPGNAADFDAGGDAAANSSVSGIDHLPKTRQAVALALAEISGRTGIANPSAALSVSSPIPVGKGMGSSSADITAAVAAVAAVAAAGIALPPEVIARIALAVEPTDGVMFPGIAMFDHRKGRIAESLGPPPPLEIIAIDRGGQVDTLAFNAVDRTAQWAAVADQTAAALALVRAGIKRGDPELVGRGATISAQAGHPPGAGEWVERAIALAAEIGAVGVNIAHSGTIVGILLDARQRRSKPAFRRAQQAFADAASVRHLRVIGGGVRRA